MLSDINERAVQECFTSQSVTQLTTRPVGESVPDTLWGGSVLLIKASPHQLK